MPCRIMCPKDKDLICTDLHTTIQSNPKAHHPISQQRLALLEILPSPVHGTIYSPTHPHLSALLALSLSIRRSSLATAAYIICSLSLAATHSQSPL